MMFILMLVIYMDAVMISILSLFTLWKKNDDNDDDNTVTIYTLEK